MASDMITYKDHNANRFPEPVEPLGMTQENISKSTVNPKDPYIMMGLGLFITHNLLRRSLLSVATHARTQPQPPSPDFLHYASFVLKFLDEHHHHEDEIFFPKLQPWIDFSESAHEHEEIARNISAVNDTLGVAGEALARNVEGLLESLDPHLKKEEWLVNRYARRIPLDVLEKVDKMLQDAIQKDSKEPGNVWILGFVKRGLTPEEYEIFPPIPWMVKYVVEYIGNWKYGKPLAYAPFQ